MLNCDSVQEQHFTCERQTDSEKCTCGTHNDYPFCTYLSDGNDANKSHNQRNTGLPTGTGDWRLKIRGI
jgi:hypothetical protein